MAASVMCYHIQRGDTGFKSCRRYKIYPSNALHLHAPSKPFKMQGGRFGGGARGLGGGGQLGISEARCYKAQQSHLWLYQASQLQDPSYCFLHVAQLVMLL